MFNTASIASVTPGLTARDINRLQHQINLNVIRNIQIYPQGLSDENAHKLFYAPTGYNAGIGSFDATSVTKGNRALGELELVRGDSFFAEHPRQNLHMIKIDVEGLEKSVLKGAGVIFGHPKRLYCRFVEKAVSLLASNHQALSRYAVRTPCHIFDSVVGGGEVDQQKSGLRSMRV